MIGNKNKKRYSIIVIYALIVVIIEHNMNIMENATKRMEIIQMMICIKIAIILVKHAILKEII